MKLIFPATREDQIHGPQVLQESIRQSRTRDEKAQGRHAEERALRQEGQEPQAGYRNWTFRGARGRQEGAEEEVQQKDVEEEEFAEEESQQVEALNRTENGRAA